MTSSSNNTDQLRYGFSDYPDHMSILWETSNAKPFVHVAQIWDDAAFQRFLAAHDAELTERVRAEQREADAQIADDMNDHWVADTIREAATDA